MKTLKKNNISQGSCINSPVPVNKNCDLPPFFNTDYFSHVVVQTLEELESIPCKLRQDGMVATVVQEDYSDYQLQTSRTGFGICDNNAWVKISIGDEVFNGGNLFLFQTEEQANEFMGSTQSKEGQIIYISDLDSYFKFDGQDGLTDAFPNKLDKPTVQGLDNPNYKIPAYLDGKPYWRSSSDFEKVKSVNSKTGDVVLKTSDLQNDSDYTTNALLNKKLNKPTTNNTNQFVILGDGSTAPKNDFGKVDTVNKIEPDSNKNVNLGIDDILPKGMPLEETLDYNKKVLLYDDTGKSYWKSLSEVGKVKTVDNIEPDENGNIKIKDSEFVKNGVGWSLKYRADNPTLYGAIGQEAVDFSISKSVNTKMPERFSYGANGSNTAVFGIYNSAMDAGSLVSGVQNRSQGQCNNIMSSGSTIIQDKGSGNFTKKDNGIYSGSNNTIENNRNSTVIGGGNNRMVGKISPVNNMYDMYNAIIGGNYNTLTNSISNIILGGTLNDIIGEEKSRENGSYNSNNAIIGGYKNKIITATGTNRQAYSSVIFGGEENIAQGYYNMVAGYGNHAVTVGEVLTGIYGTVQNTSLSGYDFISDSRMFNVGIGESTTQGVVTRKDGLSVFRNGLVTTPRLTTSLIENNSKAVTTKEFVDSKISNFKLPTNWESPQQKFSGLEDKSADATYNQFALFDSNGNLAKAAQIANAFEAGLKNTTAEQGLRIGQLLNGGQGSAGMMSVTSISPPVVEKIDSMEYLLIRGTNLYLNVTSMSIEIVKSSDSTTIGFIPNSQIQLYDNGLSLVIGYNFKDLPFGDYKLKITSGVKVLITTLTLRVVENVEHINIDTITWDVVTNSSYDFTNKYTVAGRSLWVKSPFTGVDSNVPIFSAKSSTLFNAGENFVIEFAMNYAAQNNFGSTVRTRFGLTSSDLTNILNYISLAYFNFWCMGGQTIAYNTQGVGNASKSSQTSGTLDCKIVKNGNLFTLMIESMIYAVTIPNNNNYSFIFQMPDRKFASGGEEDTIFITKAYKYN